MNLRQFQMTILLLGHQPGLLEASGYLPEVVQVVGPDGGEDDDIIQVGGCELVVWP